MMDHPAHDFLVVIIDDNEGDLNLLREAIAFTGARIRLTTFSNVLSALTYLKVTPPVHLVISDVNMPGVTGIQMLALMLEDPDLCDIPLALTSSCRFGELPTYLYQHLAVPYFVKAEDWDGCVRVAREIHAALQAGRDPLAAKRLADRLRTPCT